MFPFLSSFFANPLMLWGAMGASIPIAIHLLNKQRFKRVVWAAMHWLWASYRKSQKRLKVEQLLLLIIRTLLLLLLAMALARPALQEGLGMLTGRPSTHRIIVLDTSYSMGQLAGGRPLFEKAKDVAGELVANLATNDEIDVIFSNSAGNEHAATSSAARKNDIVGQIKAAPLSDGGTDLPRGIAAACRIMNERQSRHPRKEIIVITDQTRAGWERPDHQPRRLQGDDADAVATAFKAQLGRPRIAVMRLSGEKDLDNITPSSIEIDEKVVPVKVETQISGVIHAFSSAPRKNVRVRLKVDGEEAAVETLPNVDPGKPEPVSFRYVFAEAGSHSIAFEVDNDVLPNDNTAWLALDSEEQMRVLCVDGQQRVGPNASEMDFIRQAISPTRTDEVKAGKMPLRPEIISDSAFLETNLDAYRLIVLGNVAVVPREKILALTQYVQQGGSLMIFTGDRVDPAIYNKDLGELLPATLGELIGTGESDGPKESISEKEMEHPAIARFKGIKGLPISQLQTFRRFKLLSKTAAVKDESIRTVMAYESGDLAAVEKRLGEGRVILFGTTADKAWNNWPGKNHYMPMINFLALDLIRPAYLDRNRFVGEKFLLQLPRQELGAARREGIRLTEASGETSNFEILSERSAAESVPLRKAGVFTATVPGDNKRILHFSANRTLEESDLTPIEDREILSQVPREGEEQTDKPGYFDPAVTQKEFQLAPADDAKAVEELLKKHGGSREIWRWLVAAILVLLIAESLLAKRFGDFTR